jgi:ribosomal protein L12E/L44/L45/RPP1/RPP2
MIAPLSPAAAAQAATEEEQDGDVAEEYDDGDDAAEESLGGESAGRAERMAMRLGTAASVETPR